MDKIIDKISSYHIFNYIIPGYIFILICDRYFDIKICDSNAVNNVIIAYIVGLIIGRISSILIEKRLYYVFKIKNESYESFVKAEVKNDKLNVILQDRNMYRNLFTTFLLLLVIKVLKVFNLLSIINQDIRIIIILVGLVILFAISFKKQSIYAISRIKAVNKQK